MNKFSTKKLTRAGVIAALYVALTYVFFPISFGGEQARISEALTILPLFYIEAVPALYIGCLISNILGWGVFDITIGAFATLLAAVCTYFIGKTKFSKHLKIWLGIIPPVIFNALLIPLVIYLSGGLEKTYLLQALFIGGGELLVTATIGVALYYSVGAMREKKIGVML